MEARVGQVWCLVSSLVLCVAWLGWLDAYLSSAAEGATIAAALCLLVCAHTIPESARPGVGMTSFIPRLSQHVAVHLKTRQDYLGEADSVHVHGNW